MAGEEDAFQMEDELDWQDDDDVMDDDTQKNGVTDKTVEVKKVTQEKEKPDISKKRPKVIVPFLVPTFLEQKNDFKRAKQARTFAIGPIGLPDLAEENLHSVFVEAPHFTVYFNMYDENDSTNQEGFVLVEGKSEEHVFELMGKLKGKLRKGISLKHLIPKNNKLASLDDIRKPIVTDKDPQRTVVVTSLPKEATEAEIKEKIPKAVKVLIPKSYITNQRKGYAYVELPSKHDVLNMKDEKIYFGDIYCRLMPPCNLPTVNVVIGNINREKNLLMTTGPMESSDKERLIELSHQGLHYLRVDNVPEEQLVPLRKAMEMLQKRLRSIPRQQKGPFKAASKVERRVDKRSYGDIQVKIDNKRARLSTGGPNSKSANQFDGPKKFDFGGRGGGNMGMGGRGGRGGGRGFGGDMGGRMGGGGGMGGNMGGGMRDNIGGGGGMGGNMGGGGGMGGNMGGGGGMGGNMGGGGGMGGNMGGGGGGGMGGNMGDGGMGGNMGGGGMGFGDRGMGGNMGGGGMGGGDRGMGGGGGMRNNMGGGGMGGDGGMSGGGGMGGNMGGDGMRGNMGGGGMGGRMGDDGGMRGNMGGGGGMGGRMGDDGGMRGNMGGGGMGGRMGDDGGMRGNMGGGGGGMGGRMGDDGGMRGNMGGGGGGSGGGMGGRMGDGGGMRGNMGDGGGMRGNMGDGGRMGDGGMGGSMGDGGMGNRMGDGGMGNRMGDGGMGNNMGGGMGRNMGGGMGGGGMGGNMGGGGGGRSMGENMGGGGGMGMGNMGGGMGMDRDRGGNMGNNMGIGDRGGNMGMGGMGDFQFSSNRNFSDGDRFSGQDRGFQDPDRNFSSNYRGDSGSGGNARRGSGVFEPSEADTFRGNRRSDFGPSSRGRGNRMR